LRPDAWGKKNLQIKFTAKYQLDLHKHEQSSSLGFCVIFASLKAHKAYILTYQVISILRHSCEIMPQLPGKVSGAHMWWGLK
jgi:hypothetical protein